MDTLTIIIIGVSLAVIFDLWLFVYLRNKKKGRFKLVIEKGAIIENSANVPAEFLYDVQQLIRIYRLENLIINGKNITGNNPDLEIVGNVEQRLKDKLEQSLKLSLQ